MVKQIHEVIVHEVIHHEVDPMMGHVAKRVPQLLQGQTVRISHDGEVYDRDADGSFTLPAAAADYFCSRPNWYEGPSPFEQDMPVEKIAAKRGSAKVAA